MNIINAIFLLVSCKLAMIKNNLIIQILKLMRSLLRSRKFPFGIFYLLGIEFHFIDIQAVALKFFLDTKINFLMNFLMAWVNFYFLLLLYRGRVNRLWMQLIPSFFYQIVSFWHGISVDFFNDTVKNVFFDEVVCITEIGFFLLIHCWWLDKCCVIQLFQNQ